MPNADDGVERPPMPNAHDGVADGVSLAARRPLLAIAPMIDVTDRHFRFLIRCISPLPMLWTEMTWDRAILYNHPGERECQEGQKNVRQRTVGSIIGFSPEEHPIVLQLGGSNPESLARAAVHGAAQGYDEINLNCGCPAQRKGRSRITYGARLMFEPALVAACCASMRAALTKAGYTHVPVTVKCRLGVDHRDSWEELVEFVTTVSAAGVTHFIMHARKAMLDLDTIKNRSVPPLKHDWVLRLVALFPQIKFSMNGGIRSLEEAQLFIRQGVHGVMLGRRANADPFMFARSALVYGGEQIGEQVPSRREVLDKYTAYCAIAQPANWDETTPEGCARALLTPLTSLFHNTRFSRKWSQATGRMLLDREKLLTRSVVDLVGDCLVECEMAGPEAADVLDDRPSLEPLPLPAPQPPPAPWVKPRLAEDKEDGAWEDEEDQEEATGNAGGNATAGKVAAEGSAPVEPVPSLPDGIPDDYCRKFQEGICPRGLLCRWKHVIWNGANGTSTGTGAKSASALRLNLMPTSAASVLCEIYWLATMPPPPPQLPLPSDAMDSYDAAEGNGLGECPGWSVNDAEAGIDYDLADGAVDEVVESPRLDSGTKPSRLCSGEPCSIM